MLAHHFVGITRVLVCAALGVGVVGAVGSVGCAQEVQGAQPAIGARIDPGTTVSDRNYLPRRIDELMGEKGVAFFFVTVECPMVRRYLPRFDKLAREHAEHGLRCIAVNVAPGESMQDAMAQAIEFGVEAPFVKDYGAKLAAALGVDRTCAAVVLDAESRLVYRGRIDSQYRYGGVRPDPGRADFGEALADVVAGRAVRVAETPWEGCKITRLADVEPAARTYAADVAPIFARHCVSCHQPGGEAPFALVTYDQVVDDAEMIAEVVAQKRMPPWYAPSRFDGVFENHRGLSEDERRTVLEWVADVELPRGDRAKEPAPPEPRESEWRIGEPDLVLKVPVPARLPADGYIPYRYFVLPFRFEEDTWVEAIEILPSNKQVLHHANLAHFKWGERFSNKGFITGQVPGGDAMVLDPGVAVKIPAGSVLGLQVHYVTTGKPEVDRLRVGLRFPRVPVQQQCRPLIVTSTSFRIPPGADGYAVTATRTFREDAVGIGLFAHMHLRGRDMRFVAVDPEGTEAELLIVSNYNFDWQQSYRWPKDTKRFTKGTRIRVTGRFDNSKRNPFNPDPTQEVRFGLQTADEMMYGFLFYVFEHERLNLTIDTTTGHQSH